MTPDRLKALQHQRMVVAQHLAWLDAEIADAGMPTPADETAAPAAASTPPPAADDPRAQAEARADEILAEYAATDRFDPASARRGCIQLTLAVFALGALCLLGIYFWRYY